MSEIEYIPLSDLVEEVIDNRGRTCPTSEQGIPLIATNCIKEDSIYPTHERVRYVSDETYREWFRGHPIPGDILFVNKGAPGRVCLAPDPIDFCIAQDMVALRANKRIVSPRYLFAALRSPQVRASIDNMHVGTMIPHFKKGDFNKLFIPVPARGEQERIGDLYCDFSLAIENKRKINETLEALAKALFKSWFVDFDPVRAKAEGRPTGLPAEISDLFPDSFDESELGEIPSGWRQRELQEIASVIDPHPSHRAPEEQREGFPFAGIGDIDEMGNINRAKARVVGEESVNEQERFYEITEHSNGIGRVGTVGKVVRLRSQSFRFALSPTLAIVNPLKPYYAGVCFLLLRSPGFQSKVLSNMTGSTRPAIGIQILRKISTLLPPEDAREIYEQFESFVGNLVAKGDVINTEICLLTQARDSLLPKLISGEIRIPDAEKMLEEVGV